ncbi:hypothetical protein SUGI_0330000 [Cryptomeria japonica]|uniref:glucan endo-1,3-beta-glucosidase n=1 Tax=Cryptomeria japonica TaxID=3369 RepID=UPI002408B268|nr:glucan endo-1,3-beta-glucosidase [Cryptomeria japonica]GLJ18553.1 hypothetical protein SUGI_0330000 [Cryptomeria japonica]
MAASKKLLIFTFITFSLAFAGAESIGICYGRVADNLPPPEIVAALLTANNILKLRMFDSDGAALAAFANSPIEIITAVPNDGLPVLAADPGAAVQWLAAYVVPFYPATRIKYIAVGNEIFLGSPDYAAFLVPAMQNLHAALQAAGLSDAIKISSPHAASILANSFPPSQGAFDPARLETLKPFLDFLSQTGAPFMANIYPFFSYLNNPASIPLQYALFTSPALFVDGDLAYSNLFDATVDSLISAMERLGHPDIRVAVTETGWPWAGGNNEAENVGNAMTYNGNLVKHVLSNVGTPKRPGVGVETYLFDLFNEDQKTGQDFERDFGLFYPSGQKVYDVSFSL